MKVNTLFDNWDLRKSEVPDAKHRVLFLAGALLTAASYRELLDEPILRAASMHVVAATLPGFGRTPAPRKPSVEEYAGLAAKLAADLGCGAIVGHRNGANIAIELAAQGLFKGPAVLLFTSGLSESIRFPLKDDRPSEGILDHEGKTMTIDLSRLPGHGQAGVRGSSSGHAPLLGSSSIREVHEPGRQTLRAADLAKHR